MVIQISLSLNLTTLSSVSAWGDPRFQFLSKKCFKTGYHAYHDVWNPIIDKVLFYFIKKANPREKMADFLQKDFQYLFQWKLFVDQ